MSSSTPTQKTVQRTPRPDKARTASSSSTTTTTTTTPRVSLDLLVSTLSKTLFQPFIATLLPLCLAALATPFSSPFFIATFAFSCLVCLYHVLALLNQRLAYGPHRDIKWEDEVVLITGGCGGLGGCIAEIYALRGVAVAVLDVALAEEDDGREKEGVAYYRCDIGNVAEIEACWERVREEVGRPTVLINNAGMVRYGRVQEMEAGDVERIFSVNVFSHFLITRLFLDGLGRREGTIVTVSSVLGKLCATRLAAYSASKSALIAYHRTLSAELAQTAPQVKAILVAPGQLDTQLFAGTKVQGWLQSFLAPVLAAGELAMRIVELIDAGKGGEIWMPFYANWLPEIMATLPMSMQKGLRWWSGIDEALGQPEIQPMDCTGNSKDAHEIENIEGNDSDAED